MQLTRDVVEDLIAKYNSGITGALDEKFLVNQYNYGNLQRIFTESDKLVFEEETQNKLRQALGVTGEIDQERLANLLKDSDESYRRVAPILEELYGIRSLEALKSGTTIGAYINPMTAISSGLDLEEDIVKALQQKGVGKNIIDDIMSKTVIPIISPSDSVDLINTLSSGKQGLTTEMGGVFTSLSELMSSGTVNDLAKLNAFKRVFGAESIDKDLIGKVSEKAVAARFERIGRLRALAMQNGLDPELMDAIDPAILTRRLNNNKLVTVAMENLQAGFEKHISEDILTNNPAMLEYLNNIKEARKVEDQGSLVSNLARLVGMQEDSQYAHASQVLKLGREAHEASEAVKSAANSRRAVENMRDINMSGEASQLAENILDHFSERSKEVTDLFKLMDNKTGEESEFLKYQSALMRQNLGDEIMSMMISGAENIDNVTVQDIADNMERLALTSKYKGMAHYRTLLTADDKDPNQLINIIKSAQYNRRIKFLERQEGIKDLTNQFDSFMATHRAASDAEKADNIRTAKTILEDFNSNRQFRPAVEDARQAAALLIDIGEEANITSLLGEEDLLAARRILQLSQSRRYLEDAGMADVLAFGGRASASNFVPPPEDLPAEVRNKLFTGLEEGELNPVSKSVYRRLIRGAEDLKINKAFENPMVRGSAFALAGLVAASFIYSKAKDHGEQEISGPPLLPGGSAYENMPQRNPQIPQASMFSGYNQGIGYTVHLEGSRDQIDSFSRSAGSVSAGKIHSTMSKGLPSLGRDPYSSIAGSY